MNNTPDNVTSAVTDAGSATTPTLFDLLDQFVDAPTLRTLLWAPGCRPSLKWIRKETNNGNIPHFRRDKRVWYQPRAVRAAMLLIKPRRGPKPKGVQ